MFDFRFNFPIAGRLGGALSADAEHADDEDPAGGQRERLGSFYPFDLARSLLSTRLCGKIHFSATSHILFSTVYFVLHFSLISKLSLMFGECPSNVHGHCNTALRISEERNPNLQRFGDIPKAKRAVGSVISAIRAFHWTPSLRHLCIGKQGRLPQNTQ